MPSDRNIQYLLEHGDLSEIDIHFAKLMTRLSGQDSSELFVAAALVSRAKSEGDVCLDLSAWAEKPLRLDDVTTDSFVCPELSQWIGRISASSVVGRPGDYRPLILDAHARLYLYRYWEYENILAKKLRERAAAEKGRIDLPVLKAGLERLFPRSKKKTVDRQKLAALVSVLKRFCVISGGPGTGKSTLIAKVMALMMEQNKGNDFRISLAAPTGKAAARLQEAVRNGTEKLNVDDRIKKAIPTEASTIHRLLGTIIGSPYFRHNAENLLPAQMVVVDEASMVDLALMSKLVQAIPSEARLVLLGDKDQLASVEAGAILGDICDTGRNHEFSESFSNQLEKISSEHVDVSPKINNGPAIQNCVVALRKSFRFGPDSGIRAVSQAVNKGDAALALDRLKSGSYNDVKWKTLPDRNALSGTLQETIIECYRSFLTARDPMDIFLLFGQFRLLCGLRQGPYGVAGLNHMAEQVLREAKLIRPDTRWYRGRPVMITRNDYNLGLFNGDIGIILPDPTAGHDLRAFFLSPGGTFRKLLPLRLPEHETVYAMTVHKSQGSEFDKVLLLLPDRPTRLITRELIYTGITRAKEEVEIWGREDVFLEGVRQRIERSSGLRDALWA
jgi:exodeoxyribonuclease V alpha subunit